MNGSTIMTLGNIVAGLIEALGMHAENKVREPAPARPGGAVAAGDRG